MHSTDWKKYLFSMFLLIGSIAVMSSFLECKRVPFWEKKKEINSFIN